MDEIIADCLDQRFRLLERLSSGGMGDVYRAWDEAEKTTVAIKLARDVGGVSSQRLILEAGLVSRIGHTRAVAYVDHGLATDGRAYLAMEWLSGCDLQARLAEGPLSEEQTLEVAERLCEVLAVIHEQGIVHRDIKPANIFLVGNDLRALKLIDFGLARSLFDTASEAGEEPLVGTPGYMAPEHARGHNAGDITTDVYSLGATLFACLTQSAPFTGSNPMAILGKTLFDDAPRVREFHPQVSRPVDELVARLMAKERAQRPPSALAVRGLLKDLQRGVAELAPLAAPAVSRLEQRVFTVLIIEEPQARQRPERLTAMHERAREFGVSLQTLASGTLLAALSARDDPTQALLTAARLALAIRAHHPSASVGIATGRGLLNRAPTAESAGALDGSGRDHFGGRLVGRVIDRASAMVFGYADTVVVEHQAADEGPAILVDEVSARLLGDHFRLRPHARDSYALHAPRARSRWATGDQLEGLLGRERELAELRAQFTACTRDSRAASTVVVGAGGMGKTRLVQELVTELRARPEAPLILAAHSDMSHAPVPFALARRLLRAALQLSRTAADGLLEEQLARHLALLLPAERVDSCAAFLAELLGIHLADGDRITLREARRDRRLMYDQILRAWDDWLAATAARRPVVFVLDDLHAADNPSIHLLRKSLRDLHGLPIWMLALARPAITERFPDLWANPLVTKLSMTPLSGTDARRLVHRRLMPRTDALAEFEYRDDPDVAAIVRRAAGNPLYLELLTHELMYGQKRDLADTILAVAGARLQVLSADQRQVVRAASVFGHECQTRGLATLLDCSDERLTELLGQLCEADIMAVVDGVKGATAPDGGEDSLYQFLYSPVREAAYAMLTALDRAQAHERVGDFFARGRRTEPALIADHYRRSGCVGKALPWLVRAAEEALAANDTQGALEYADMAITSGVGGADLGRVRLLQSECYNWNGDHERALATSKEALELVSSDTPMWAQAAHQQIWAAGGLGRFDVLQAAGDRLLGCLDNHPRVEHAIALAWCATHLTAAGCNRRAAWLVTFIEQLRPGLGEAPSLDAVLAHDRGALALVSGWNDRSAESFAEAARHWLSAGSRLNAALEGCNHAESLLMLGQYEAAEAILREHVAVADRLQADFLGSAARHFLAVCLWRKGAHAEAEALLGTLLSEDAGDHQQASIAITRARLLLARGLAGAAEDVLSALLPTLAEFPHTRALALAVRARVALALERPERALEWARAGVELLGELGFIEDGDAALRLVHIRALAANGYFAEAAAAIEQARSYILSRADTIANPDWRHSFVTRVAENAQTLALAQQAGRGPVKQPAEAG